MTQCCLLIKSDFQYQACSDQKQLFLQNLWRWLLLSYCGPFYWHDLTLIPAWISNYIHYKVWDEITYPFLNFNGATVEV